MQFVMYLLGDLTSILFGETPGAFEEEHCKWQLRTGEQTKLEELVKTL